MSSVVVCVFVCYALITCYSVRDSGFFAYQFSSFVIDGVYYYKSKECFIVKWRLFGGRGFPGPIPYWFQ